ncbi:unnamed protein product [Caenorhabditis auriculariae]|uniref:DEK-C domain-containing protein n=1 Tax=Caenorhabditis auriculariae TaxID=2777116 RepID=A0A8S1HJ10_9PELO|nr:unnamed protein product [Caenorhabditis auriculariae]
MGEVLPVETHLVREEIEKLVESVSLNELTSGKIRKHLQDKFDKDFAEFKAVLNELTKKAIEAFQAKKASSTESSDDSDDDDEVAKPAEAEVTSTSEAAGKASESDSDSDHGLASTQRAKATRGRKRKASNDGDDLATIVKSSRREAATRAKQSMRKSAGFAGRIARQSSSTKEKKDSDKIGPKTKLSWVSPELQIIVGKPYTRRCDIVKSMWKYRFAICDPTLFNIFKKKRFQVFGMARHLSKHVREPHDMGQEYMDEAEEEKRRQIAEYNARQQEKADESGSEGAGGEDSRGGAESEGEAVAEESD